MRHVRAYCICAHTYMHMYICVLGWRELRIHFGLGISELPCSLQSVFSVLKYFKSAVHSLWLTLTNSYSDSVYNNSAYRIVAFTLNLYQYNSTTCNTCTSYTSIHCTLTNLWLFGEYSGWVRWVIGMVEPPFIICQAYWAKKFMVRLNESDLSRTEA